MDLERAIEFLLEQQAASQARFDAQQALINARAEEQQARFDAQQTRFDAQKTRFDAQISKVDDSLYRVAALQEKTQSQADRTEATLRRAIQLSVTEHRRERVRRKALEEEMKKLATSQAMTQESLRAFIESLKQPRNGHDTV
jgi:hypothetical protein